MSDTEAPAGRLEGAASLIGGAAGFVAVGWSLIHYFAAVMLIELEPSSGLHLASSWGRWAGIAFFATVGGCLTIGGVFALVGRRRGLLVLAPIATAEAALGTTTAILAREDLAGGLFVAAIPTAIAVASFVALRASRPIEA